MYARLALAINNALDARGSDGDGEDSMAMLPSQLLQPLHEQLVALKTDGRVNELPLDVLTTILSVLHNTVHEACSEPETMALACEAACTSLVIMTAPNMPKGVFLSEVIDGITTLLQRQLLTVVLPAYNSEASG